MLEVWQTSKGVSSLFRDLHRALRGRPTWTSADAYDVLRDRYSMDQITKQIHNMIAGKHVVRLSRGVYRFRGIV